MHGHLLTKSHGVVGYGVAETVAVRIERAGIVPSPSVSALFVVMALKVCGVVLGHDLENHTFSGIMYLVYYIHIYIYIIIYIYIYIYILLLLLFYIYIYIYIYII